MTSPVDRSTPPFEFGLDMEFFQVSGLLWAINHLHLHPLGLALAVAPLPVGDAVVPAFTLNAAEDGVWQFTPDIDVEKSADWAAFLTWLRGGELPPKMAAVVERKQAAE